MNPGSSVSANADEFIHPARPTLPTPIVKLPSVPLKTLHGSFKKAAEYMATVIRGRRA